MKTIIEKKFSKIENMREALADELYLYVEQLARAALQKHKRLKSFIMCMGKALFVVDMSEFDDNGLLVWEQPDEYISITEAEAMIYAKELHDLYDIMSNLRVTGRPMKIVSAFEPVLTDW